MARAINSEVKAGRGTPHGGVYLDIASRMPAEEIKRRLPSMYHQFIELAEVDITKDEMEVGPTCHYVMGGIEVDPDTGGAATPGLFAAGECSGGMHGSNRLGGNSLSDLLVFGRRAGLGAADYVRALTDRPKVTDDAIEAATTLALEPFEPKANPENPYTLHAELQQSMNDLVGIIRKEEEIQEALAKLDELKRRYATSPSRAAASSTRAGTWPSTCATCCWSASAWPRRRCSAPRAVAVTPATTIPKMDANWRNTLLVCRTVTDGDARSRRARRDRRAASSRCRCGRICSSLFELSELEKYFTDEELAEHPERRG